MRSVSGTCHSLSGLNSNTQAQAVKRNAFFDECFQKTCRFFVCVLPKRVTRGRSNVHIKQASTRLHNAYEKKTQITLAVLNVIMCSVRANCHSSMENIIIALYNCSDQCPKRTKIAHFQINTKLYYWRQKVTMNSHWMFLFLTG